MAKEKFVTAINCMDGRVQQPVAEYLIQTFQADYVDTITEPGPDKLLIEGPQAIQDSIKNRVFISVNAHGSRILAIAAHHDCAGNPVAKDKHLEMLQHCISHIDTWMLPIRLLALWIGPDWKVELIHDSQTN